MIFSSGYLLVSWVRVRIRLGLDRGSSNILLLRFFFSSRVYDISAFARACVSGDKGTAQLGPARSVGRFGTGISLGSKNPNTRFSVFILGLLVGFLALFSRRGAGDGPFDLAHGFYFGNGMDLSSHKTMGGWVGSGRKGMAWDGLGLGLGFAGAKWVLKNETIG